MKNPVELGIHSGKQFRYSLMARKEADSGNGFLLAWFRVDRNDELQGFFDNMWDRSIKSSEWQRYVIEGQIDEEAASLHYGIMVFNEGRFHVDDVTFEVKNEDGEWEKIPLENGGFEKPVNEAIPDWNFRFEEPEGFTQKINTKDSPEGKQHLVLECLLPYRSNRFYDLGNHFIGYWETSDGTLVEIAWGPDTSYLVMNAYEKDHSLFNSQIILYDEEANTLHGNFTIRRSAVLQGTLEKDLMTFSGEQKIKGEKRYNKIAFRINFQIEDGSLVHRWSGKHYLNDEVVKDFGTVKYVYKKIEKPDDME